MLHSREGLSELAQWVTAFAAKFDELSSMPIHITHIHTMDTHE